MRRTARQRSESNIHAVAARAGVSISSVSRCLSGKRKLAPAVEARILTAARSLGYTPNRAARSLRSQRTMLLAMVIPDSGNPYFSDVVKGAEAAARAAGYVLVLLNSDEDRAREEEHLVTVRSLRCDGALLVPASGGAPSTARRPPPGDRPPLVFLGRDPGIAGDVVLIDSLKPSFEVARKLADLGHRRMALLRPLLDTSQQRDRGRGFRDGLAKSRLHLDGDLDVRANATVADGLAATTRLLSRSAPPTALFATNNALAIGAVAAVRALGLRCPDDISIVGYDSYPWQEHFEPRLSTVEQPAYELGQRAAQLLLGRITGTRTGPPDRIELAARLTMRGSCAPLPRPQPR